MMVLVQRWSFIFVGMVWACCMYGQQVLHVHQGATGANDGSSWQNAYTDLQDAIASAQQHDAIWIAAGTYRPTATLDRTISFQLDSNVAWYGGFGGWESALEERDPATHATILSGNIGDPADSTDNSRHVVRADLAGGLAILDGLIIEEGHGMVGPFQSDQGAGLYATGSDLLLRGCTFRRCWAPGGGGGAAIWNSSMNVVECTFLNNSASGGGGLLTHNGYGELIGCVFRENRAEGNSGMAGAASLNSTMDVSDCLFERNTAQGQGGALSTTQGAVHRSRFLYNTAGGGGGAIVVLYGSAKYAIYGCDFIGNRTVGTGASHSGGAVKADAGFGSGPSIRLFGSRFIGNHTEGNGGALYASYRPADVQSCVFDGNTAGRNGGAVFYSAGTARCRIVNSTFVRNHAQELGKALVDESYHTDSTWVVNSIFWGHAQPEIDHFPNGAPVRIWRSVVQGNAPGTDLFTADPQFVDLVGPDGLPSTGDEDLRLSAASYGIDGGTADTTGLKLFWMDAAGEQRSQGTVDLGAYEQQECSVPPSAAVAMPDTVLCGGTVLYVHAQEPVNGVGAWRVIEPFQGTFNGPYDIDHHRYSTTARVVLPTNGTSYFEWSVSKCGVVHRDTVKVIRSAVPAAPVVVYSGALALCPGDSAELSVADPAGVVEWSTGNQGPSNLVDPGIHTARIMGECPSPWSAPVVIIGAPVPQTPVIQAMGSLLICEGSGASALLTSTVPAAVYQWSTGATTSSLVVDSTAAIALVVENIQGCQSATSDTVHIAWHARPPVPELIWAGDTVICADTTVVIGTSTTATGYHWNNGSSGTEITTASAGNYWLTVSDTHGCVSLPSDTVALVVLPVPVVPVIQVTYTSATTANLRVPHVQGATYVWYMNGEVVQGVSGNQLSGVDEAAYYEVETTIAGCTSQPGGVVVGVGLAEHAGAAPLQVYPNPTAGSFTVRCNVPRGEAVGYVLLDRTGRRVLEGTVRQGMHEGFTLDASSLNSGTYDLVIRHKEELRRAVLVVLH